MKIVFMGTPQFAVPCLEAIVGAGHDVKCVFTQPDKPCGRGYKLKYSEVKECAIKYGIEVFQPEKLKSEEVERKLSDIDADIIVVVAYGKILPKYILDMPKYGCVNVHGSLLPKYRGAAPIQWSVINGESVTGVTTMYMDEGMDTGDIIFKSETAIKNDETSGELYSRLAGMGAKLIVKTLLEIEHGKALRLKQNESEATYAPMLKKDMGKINWNKSAVKIHNLIRGVNPWPVAFTKVNGKNLKVYGSKIAKIDCDTPGKVLSVKPFIVGCGEGTALEITEVQLEGKKRMLAEEFARGQRINTETVFELE